MSSSYLSTTLNPLDRKVVCDRLITAIKSSGIIYDAIACRGVSGITIASMISYILEKNLIVVRKEDVNKDTDCHGAYNCEIPDAEDIETYIIIDDFIASGNTVNKIVELLSNPDDLTPGLICVGVFTHAQHWNYREIESMFADQFPIIMTHPKDIVELEERREWEKTHWRSDKNYILEETLNLTNKSERNLLQVE